MALAADRQHPPPSSTLGARLKVIETELVESNKLNLVCNKASNLYVKTLTSVRYQYALNQ